MEVVGGRSFNNGIEYLSTNDIKVRAFRKKDKTIETRIYPELKYAYDRRKNKIPIIAKFILIALVAYYLFPMIPIKIVRDSIAKIIIALYFIYALIMLPLGIVISIKLDKEIFRYHSAEHIIFNFYKQNKALPTYYSDKLRFSKLSRYCGTMHIGNIMEASIALAFYLIFFGYDCRMLAIIPLTKLMLILRISFLGIFSQITKLRNPECRHLEIAIVAIKTLEYIDNRYENNCELIFESDEEMLKYMELNNISTMIIYDDLKEKKIIKKIERQQ